MVLTMAAVADHKGIQLTRMAAVVEGRTEFADRQASPALSAISTWARGLTARETRILYNAARQCEVHKMLHGEITFEERLFETGR
jgi:hypothetical protein